ncbi:MAG: inorganic phosphate transporter [Alistipes sp.]|nr:inorganic phosphate transporter [Alistipes sp.]
MEWIYTFMLAVMVVLAITGLFIGVMNDAANFLNSAIASKAATLRIIMAVASVGIIVGAASSSGMMEIARSGMFAPELFTFRDVMVLYLSVMLANIILLDIYNTMGLPTSTTVALVFCLLGSAVAVSLHNPDNTLSDCIKSDRALAIVAGILLSVVLAFTCGCVVMYISRLLFSFRYKPVFRRFGALWCGISFTAIVYFALFKGLKDLLKDNPVIQFIDQNLLLSLAAIWVVCSILLYFVQMFKVNILKINILAGTFALALAFAGNDLVNFVGVPVAGYDSYNIAKEMGGDQTITMEALTNDATANTKLLLAAGIIMIITLWTSKRALSVSKTELSLSSQDEGGGEQYGSTSASRGLVRMAMAINTSYERIMPQRIQQAIAKRFEPLSQEEREGGSYDLIRATVNLTTAAILISIATSLKLPLSTTYVCFMVSMGSSLADRAWGRESAVYRISGVLTVVSGWFITGFGAMLIAFVVALVLAYGGNVAIVLVSLMCGYMLLHSNLKKNKQAAQAEEAKPEVISAEDAINRGITDVIDTMRSITKIYDRTLIATFKENRKALKEVVQQSNEIYERSKERKYEIMPTIARMTEHEINAAQYYVQVVDYLNEISKSLIHITRPCFDHIDNNHEGMSKEQIDDLMKINDDVEQIFSHVNIMLQRNDFGDLDLIMELRDQLFESISEATANQLLRIKHKETSTKASMLYLTILNETKTLVLHSRNLVKSQRYFLEHKFDKR